MIMCSATVKAQNCSVNTHLFPIGAWIMVRKIAQCAEEMVGFTGQSALRKGRC